MNSPDTSNTERFELDFSYGSGDKVTLTVEHPKGRAISAVRALTQLGEDGYATSLLKTLRDDPSVAEFLAEAGWEGDEYEEDDL